MTQDDALLKEYELKFNLINKELEKFKTYFSIFGAFTVFSLGIFFSKDITIVNNSLKSYICISNIILSMIVLVFYIQTRKRFFRYGKRVKEIADHLGIHGYLWNNDYNIDKYKKITIPFVGMLFVLSALSIIWVKLLLAI